MFQEGYYENLGNKLYNKLPDFRAKYASLATVSQISLILGLISDSTRKVKRVLEIGVYNGVTSLYMLKTGIATTPDYKQYGLDISTADFCGDAVLKEATEDELKHFSLHKGKTCLNINEVLDEKDKLDLVFIDGGHSHPWPLLDLVNIIPFLHKDSII